MDHCATYIRIGQFAKMANKTQRAVRHYEELGLLKPQHRSAGGFREYSFRDLETLSVIDSLQEAGVELKDIQRMRSAPSKHNIRPQILESRDELESLKERAREKIERLSALVNSIDDLTNKVREACETCNDDHASCSSCNESGLHNNSLAKALLSLKGRPELKEQS